MAWILKKKPKFLGLLTGSIAGLATITPAAGYVTVPTSALIGIISGIVCYGAISLKNRMGWDDALDVWGVHGVGGTLGILCSASSDARGQPNGANGLLLGGTSFFFKQAAAVFGFSAYAFGFTYLALVPHQPDHTRSDHGRRGEHGPRFRPPRRGSVYARVISAARGAPERGFADPSAMGSRLRR